MATIRIPSDLSVYALSRQATADRTGALESATLVAAWKGEASGGTIDSGRAMFEAIAADKALRADVTNPYLLSQQPELEPDLGKQSDSALGRASSIDPSLKGWYGSFVMATHNTKLVRRSNALLGHAYGKRLKYREVMSAGKSALSPAIALAMAGGLACFNLIGPSLTKGLGKRIFDGLAPKPGDGPDQASRDAGWFRSETFAQTESGARYKATCAAKGDPGYAATAVMLGESALCLAFDRDQLSTVTGVVTPAAVMAEPLGRRLRAAGMTLQVERLR
ncbi:MAG: hypothetical protein QM778_07045 [Myxococcales bacterium]